MDSKSDEEMTKEGHDLAIKIIKFAGEQGYYSEFLLATILHMTITGSLAFGMSKEEFKELLQSLLHEFCAMKDAMVSNGMDD